MVNKDMQSSNSNYGSHLTPTTQTFRATIYLKGLITESQTKQKLAEQEV